MSATSSGHGLYSLRSAQYIRTMRADNQEKQTKRFRTGEKKTVVYLKPIHRLCIIKTFLMFMVVDLVHRSSRHFLRGFASDGCGLM